jgi:HD-like signal output (HDOD) protein/CheY-like chemotaxis protein
MKRRILFVDDEPMVLSALQRLLRTLKAEWDMEFVTSGEEALALMARAPFDAIVSDIRMPLVNGAQLLREVATCYPQTMRIVLSGQADPELVYQCVGSAHQFLAKPCDLETLQNAIQRTFALEELLKGDPIKEIVSQMDAMPSLPALYHQIMEELSSPEASMDCVGQIIARDPAMTAKVLQLVNSAFFGLRRQISNPADAAMLLGMQTIKTLVLWIHVFSHYREVRQTLPDFSIEALADHSLNTGLLARKIICSEGGHPHAQDEAMTAGLLHDVGKLVLSVSRPASCARAMEHARARQIPLHLAERELFGTSHAEVGAYLLGLWGLPFNIVEAVALHHTPRACGSKALSALLAVHVADALQNQQQPDDLADARLDDGWIAETGHGLRLEAWRGFLGGDEPAS